MSPSQKTSWDNVIDEYLTSARTLHRAKEGEKVAHYVEELESKARMLARWADSQCITLSLFDAAALDKYIVWRMTHGNRGKGTGKRTLETDAICAKKFFRFCRERKKIKRDPLERYVVPKAPKAYVPMPKEDYLAKLLQVIENRNDPKKNPQAAHQTPRKRRFLKSRDTAVLMGLISIACRIGELCRLRLCDVDTAGLTVTFRDTKSNKARTVPITSDWAAAVREWLKHRPDVECETLFMSDEGKPLNTNSVRQQWDRYEKWGNLPHYTRHSVRHYGLTQLTATNPRSAQILAGHAHIGTTIENYDHTDIEQVRKDLLAADPLGKVLAQMPTKRGRII